MEMQTYFQFSSGLKTNYVKLIKTKCFHDQHHYCFISSDYEHMKSRG